MMETTNIAWRNIAGLMITRINDWLEDDSRQLNFPNHVDLGIYAGRVEQRLSAMMLRSKFHRILDGQINCLYVEGFFVPIATAIILGFMTPEEVKRYIAPEDCEFMELALAKELSAISADITDPTWKPPNRINNGENQLAWNHRTGYLQGL